MFFTVCSFYLCFAPFTSLSFIIFSLHKGETPHPFSTSGFCCQTEVCLFGMTRVTCGGSVGGVRRHPPTPPPPGSSGLPLSPQTLRTSAGVVESSVQPLGGGTSPVGLRIPERLSTSSVGKRQRLEKKPPKNKNPAGRQKSTDPLALAVQRHTCTRIDNS